jgi:hypothetical protein
MKTIKAKDRVFFFSGKNKYAGKAHLMEDHPKLGKLVRIFCDDGDYVCVPLKDVEKE